MFYLDNIWQLLKLFKIFYDHPQNYAVIATDSVAARGLVNGWCLPRSGRRDILSVAIAAFIFIGVILRIIVKFFLRTFETGFRNFMTILWQKN